MPQVTSCIIWFLTLCMLMTCGLQTLAHILVMNITPDFQLPTGHLLSDGSQNPHIPHGRLNPLFPTCSSFGFAISMECTTAFLPLPPVAQARKFVVRLYSSSLLVSHGCCNRFPQWGGLHNRKNFSHNLEVRSPKSGITGLKPRCLQGHALSGGSRGELLLVSSSFWPAFHSLWPHHSDLYSMVTLPFSLCQISLCILLMKTLVSAFRTHWIIEDNFPILRSVTQSHLQRLCYRRYHLQVPGIRTWYHCGSLSPANSLTPMPPSSVDIQILPILLPRYLSLGTSLCLHCYVKIQIPSSLV